MAPVFSRRVLLMSLNGPILVIAEHSAADLVAAIEAAGAFPIIELAWREATAAVAELSPTAVIIAEPPAPATETAARELAERLWEARPVIPLFARVAEGAVP